MNNCANFYNTEQLESYNTEYIKNCLDLYERNIELCKDSSSLIISWSYDGITLPTIFCHDMDDMDDVNGRTYSNSDYLNMPYFLHDLSVVIKEFMYIFPNYKFELHNNKLVIYNENNDVKTKYFSIWHS